MITIIGLIAIMILGGIPLSVIINWYTADVTAQIVFWILWIIPPLSFPLNHIIKKERLQVPLHFIGELWFGISMYIAFACAIVYMMIGISFILGKANWFGFFVTMSGPLVLAIFIVIYVVGILNGLKVRTRNITIKGNVESSVRIALISDLHFGSFSTVGMLRRAVDAVNATDADVCVIAGDFFDMNLESLKKRDKYLETMKEIKSKNGVIGVLGNHDLYIVQKEKSRWLKETGVRILKDESVKIGELTFIGRRDKSDRNRLDSSAVYRDIQPDKTIVIDHNPALYKEAVANGVLALLCGHTHGGQTFPADFFQRAIVKYPIYGHFLSDKTNIVITSGVGYWGPPVRIGVCNEVMCINIIPDKENKE